MRPVFAVAAMMLALAACSPGNEGRLTPEPATGVSNGQGEGDVAAAELREGDLIATVSGTWASQGHQALDLTYRNVGAVPYRVDLGGLGIKLRDETAVLDTVDDVTGVDVSKPGNTTEPKTLAGGTGSPTLVVPAGETRAVLARFANFRSDPRIHAGDKVEVMLPLLAQPRRVVFRAEHVATP